MQAQIVCLSEKSKTLTASYVIFALTRTRIMKDLKLTRRSLLAGAGASLVTGASARALEGYPSQQPTVPAQSPSDHPFTGSSQPGDADRDRRMKWWHDARFGMFIHFGVYSTIGRHE